MKFFRLDLLTLLISLFILNSCKNPDGVGLDIDDSNQLSGTLIVDSNVVLNTEKDDSVLVSDMVRAPLGLFNDPEIGLTESNIITNINLPNQAKYTLPEGAIVVDSAILALKYAANGFYGDSLNSMYKVNVYRLREKPVASVSYFSNKKWQFDDEAVLGTKTFRARPHDTIKINDIVDGKPDTITRVVPQIRVPMDISYVRGLLFSASSQTESNTAFQNFAKGFYITLDKTGTTGTGGIIGISSTDTLKVYIRVTEGDVVDTTIVPIVITRHIAEIKHTYNATVEAVLADQVTPNTKAYVKGMGGLRTKITFPGLAALKGKNIIINRAELVIVPVAGTTSPYTPLPRLMMYKFDLAKQRTNIEDAIDGRTGYAGLFGGLYTIPIKNEYRFLVTNYIQNLVKETTTDYGTYIGAADESDPASTFVGATAYPIARTILFGKNSPYRLRLNIIYTDIK